MKCQALVPGEDRCADPGFCHCHAGYEAAELVELIDAACCADHEVDDLTTFDPLVLGADPDPHRRNLILRCPFECGNELEIGFSHSYCRHHRDLTCLTRACHEERG
jgi:hypothetical protein